MTFTALKRLTDELDAWAWTGTPAELWWRDDDAAEPEIALDTLINLTEEHHAPCGLAVIPAKADAPLRKFIAGTSYIWVLQHGYAHINHAPSGAGAWELGLHRPTTVILDELRDGKVKLEQLFNDRFVPVIVPPWNKIDPELYPSLVAMGFRGVSTSYKRNRPVPPQGLFVADAHCDLLSWKDKERGAKFAGADKCVDHLVSHLSAKRKGRAHPTEPTCVLSHHLEMDDEAWTFLKALLITISAHTASKWVSPIDIWPNK